MKHVVYIGLGVYLGSGSTTAYYFAKRSYVNWILPLIVGMDNPNKAWICSFYSAVACQVKDINEVESVAIDETAQSLSRLA